MIRIFNITERKEMGGVLENLGSVNMIESCKSHVITGSEQGMITIWRRKDWTNMHVFKAHRSAVTGLALHPSEKMLISSGRDRKVMLWNMVKARASYKTRLERAIEELQWSPCGNFFIGRMQYEVRYFSPECNLKEEFVRFRHNQTIVNCGFLADSDTIFVADMQAEVILWKLRKGTISFKAHDTRLCRASFVMIENRRILVTVTTLGELKIWNITAAVNALKDTEKGSDMKIENPDDMLIFTTDLKCRCSSLAVSQMRMA